eukprot:4496706-Prymnesium_polylepis.1
MPDRKVSRVAVVSWCCRLRLRWLRPSDDYRDSSRSPIGALRTHLKKQWAPDVMVRVQSGTDTQAAELYTNKAPLALRANNMEPT